MTQPWNDWEDYLAGLYENRPVREEMVKSSVSLLSDSEQFYEVALEMLEEWPTSANQNLVNAATGHQAWVGQASCKYAHGATAEETRLAWGRMSNTAQDQANGAADAAIEGWLRGRQY